MIENTLEELKWSIERLINLKTNLEGSNYGGPQNDYPWFSYELFVTDLGKNRPLALKFLRDEFKLYGIDEARNKFMHPPVSIGEYSNQNVDEMKDKLTAVGIEFSCTKHFYNDHRGIKATFSIEDK